MQPVPSFHRHRTISSAEIMDRAAGLGAVLRFPSAAYRGRERAAYLLMSHTLAMPFVPDRGRRQNYGNEILGNAGRLMSPDADPDNSVFIRFLSPIVAEMYVFPFWFSDLNLANDKLVDECRIARVIADGVKLSGLTVVPTLGSGLWGGVKEVLKPGVRPPGLAPKAATLTGHFVRGGSEAAVKKIAGGFTQRSAVLWVIGSAIGAIAIDRARVLGLEVDRRLLEKKITVEQFHQAMGDDTRLPYKYFRPL